MNKVCPVCEAINDPKALVCSTCGSTFTSGRTLKIDSPNTEEGGDNVDIVGAYHDCLIFFINGDDTPIIIPRRVGRITMGRDVPGSDRPTLDLMDYQAGMLGVSRIHASIEQLGHSISLIDLQSTNGTWLNGKRLYPNAPSALRTGDQIRLGEMNITIFFHAEDKGEQTLIFANNPKTGVNPKYLSNQVNTLLTALGDLQHIVDHINGHSPLDMTINAIVVAKHQRTISVSVENIPDAAQLFQEVIEPWKVLHYDLIQQRTDELQRAQVHLVHDLLNTINNQFSEDERENVTQQLMPVLQGIIFSTISLKPTDTHQEHYP